MTPRRATALPLLLLALAAGGLVVHALQYPFVTDDAYISFRYSHNLAYHNQLTFNLGERVEGYTNFLWTLSLGLLLKAGLRPDAMSRILGAAFGVLSLFLLYALGRVYRGGRPSGWDTLAALLLAATAHFAVWCSGGLETQMFSALVLGGIVLYLAGARAPRGGGARRALWPSGLCFALAAMTRPEGLMFFGLTGLHRLGANLLGERRLLPTRRELGWLCGFLVPFGAFFLWRYLYYGYPLPNTFYVKASGGATASALKWGLPYLGDFLLETKLYLLAPLLLVFRPRTPGSPAAEDAPPRPRFVWSYLVLLTVPFAGYVVLVGGDFMAMGRFLVPILPIVFFFAQEALRELSLGNLPLRKRPELAPGTWHPVRFATVAVILAGLATWNSILAHRESRKLSYRRWGLDTVAYLDKFAADRIKIGRWLRRNLPASTYLAVGGAGAIVYASQMRALDTFGLNDLFIAHRAPASGDRPGHTKSAPEDYILRQRPDLMCHQAKHQDLPYRPPPFEESLWRQRGYRWVCLDPPGLRPAFYCCLKRIDRDLGPLFPAEVGS